MDVPATAPEPKPIVVAPSTLREYYPAPSDATVRFKKQKLFGSSDIVEVRTGDDVRAYLNSFNHMLDKKHIEDMVKLFETNPKRFNRIANSGMFDLINSDYIDNITYQRLFRLDINENVFFSNRTLNEISLVKSQLSQQS